MLDQIVSVFRSFIFCEWSPTPEQVDTLKELLFFAKQNGYTTKSNSYSIFIEAVNQKLALNSSAYQNILDTAHAEGVKLNYLHKTRIRSFLDSGDKNAFSCYLKENSIYTPVLDSAFAPVAQQDTVAALDSIIKEDPKYLDVLHAIFSRFCFGLFDEQCAYECFSDSPYVSSDYFDFLSRKYPDMCSRDNSLVFVDVSNDLFEKSYIDGCSQIFSAILDAYKNLNNHCDLAVYIPPIYFGAQDIQWKLYSDIVLYAEKCIVEKLNRPYFKSQKIAKITSEYIESLSMEEAAFDYAFQGFVYKDCFVVRENIDQQCYALLLIFEKNSRDERPVNCPACRSTKIQGNSYPILNVRSWECENPLCPDRSKYNRGKRYAFSSVMRQRLMQDEYNRIPAESVAKWHLDYVDSISTQDIFEMVLRHYSCVHDSITLVANNSSIFARCSLYGRHVQTVAFPASYESIYYSFKKSAYFNRYLLVDAHKPQEFGTWDYNNTKVCHGDSYDVLRMISDSSIDGAVTSPPYYNAKAYSQWPNIYCYLYDMFNISKEVYRVLKPGSVYLFNIFDYFDNENNIVFSAMGNKRMILGAYMLDIFERIGFTIQGNIIWNKGEIQGNRSFNQGNFTPYYQAPLNCWEHIFILSKGTPLPQYDSIVSCVKNIRPVIKMVRGKNVLGHTAPYPKELPELLISHMTPGQTVIDPFLGSGTTCIVANAHGVSSIGIERDAQYFDLCKRLIENSDEMQLSMF